METPPDPADVSMAIKVIGVLSAVIVPSWAGWNWLDRRFARKHQVANDLQVISNEIAVHRGYFKDVFQQMRDMEKLSEARHRELLMHIMRKGEP